jgi:hypothetical protein
VAQLYKLAEMFLDRVVVGVRAAHHLTNGYAAVPAHLIDDLAGHLG